MNTTSFNVGALVFGVALAFSGCGQKQSTSAATNNSSGNPLTAPADYLGAVNQAQKAAVRTADLVSLNNAIQMFYAQEDRYPKDLNELRQKQYIQHVPQPPAGSRYEYNSANGELKVVRE